MAENQYDFPTEVLALPSKGLLYPEDSPLRSGNIDVKYMTAKDEDILTSRNLIEKGTVIDKLLENIIADSKVKLKDLLIGDKNALMLGTRVLGYGKDYVIKMDDPDTGLEVEHTFDLTELKTKKIDEKIFVDGKNEFEFKLPKAKKVITFKMLTHGDEVEIAQSLKQTEKLTRITGISHELTTRLKKQIIAIDGETERKIINEFVDNQFLALDTKEFRAHAVSITPDIEFDVEIESQIGEPRTVSLPIGVEFFWPELKR